MVDVVQLVEHRIVVPSVVGSSPIIHPIKKETRKGLFFCSHKTCTLTCWTKKIRDYCRVE